MKTRSSYATANPLYCARDVIIVFGVIQKQVGGWSLVAPILINVWEPAVGYGPPAKMPKPRRGNFGKFSFPHTYSMICWSNAIPKHLGSIADYFGLVQSSRPSDKMAGWSACWLAGRLASQRTGCPAERLNSADSWPVSDKEGLFLQGAG